MALYVMADLHLDTLKNEKSMDVFGNRWVDYVNKIKKNWTKLITDADTVVIPGDICWALNLEEAKHDIKWIDALPGKKIFLKGNHDFWWTTASKTNKFFEENSISSISVLNNSAIDVGDFIICGSRGWFTDGSMQTSVANTNVNYSKIINRETIRLRMSLDTAKALKGDSDKEILVFLHFPPIWGDFRCEEIISLLREYNIRKCFFGHIHSSYNVPASFTDENITFTLISADFLDFIPYFIG